jgi:hypothetical protein
MVMTRPVAELVALERDDFLVSDVRPVSAVAPWWRWVNGDERAEYDAFVEHLRHAHGFTGEPLTCVFIIACMPRSFMERFTALERPELGFLEYKLPTYAAIFGHRVVIDERFRCWRAADPSTRGAPPSERLLNGFSRDVRLRTIYADRWRNGSKRGLGVYHPYRAIFPFDLRSAPPALAQITSRTIRMWAARPKA